MMANVDCAVHYASNRMPLCSMRNVGGHSDGWACRRNDLSWTTDSNLTKTWRTAAAVTQCVTDDHKAR